MSKRKKNEAPEKRDPKPYKLKRTYPRVEPDLEITGALLASVSDRGKVDPKLSRWTEIELYGTADRRLAAAVVHRTAFPDETDVFRAVIRDTGPDLLYALTEAGKHWWDVDGAHQYHVCRHPLFDLIERALWEAGAVKVTDADGMDVHPDVFQTSQYFDPDKESRPDQDRRPGPGKLRAGQCRSD